MSDVEANSFKSADIIYIGYLSGMGMLQDMVMTGSRFAIGDSYDEIIDKASGHSYISQVGTQHFGTSQRYGSETPYRDYGLFATFRGPGGNSIIVISGTRDEGVQQTAEAFATPEKLAEFSRRTDTAQSFEALIEVNALDGANMGGKLLLESARDYKTN